MCCNIHWEINRPGKARKVLGIRVATGCGVPKSWVDRFSSSVREKSRVDPVLQVEEQDLAHDMTGSQAHKYASQGIYKGKASVVYLEGLWTSLLSKWYPDMVSERFDVTTVVILSRAAAQNSNGLEDINT